MAYYEAICFDFDGVLADSEPVHFDCWSEVLKPLGIQLDWNVYVKYCIGVPDALVAEFFRHQIDPPATYEAVWAQHARKRELFRARVQADPPISDAVRECIKSLSDYRLALVSASSRSELEPLLERAGLRACFDALVCAEDVERTKPAPDPYLLAVRLLGVTKALAVEDSASGIESARAAGLDVLEVGSPAEMPNLLRARLANFR
jgi:beta-phosphoglucomutase